MLGRVINLGRTTNIRHDYPRHTLCNNLSDTIVLERVIDLGDTTKHHRRDHPRHAPMQKFI
jgi:hypothetical protein